MGKWHERTNTPLSALVTQSVVGLCLVAFASGNERFETLVEYTGPCVLVLLSAYRNLARRTAWEGPERKDAFLRTALPFDAPALLRRLNLYAVVKHSVHGLAWIGRNYCLAYWGSGSTCGWRKKARG